MSFWENFYANVVCVCFVICSLYFLTVSPSPLLVISFDGFRYDYLDLYKTPNLHRMAKEGVRAKWMTSVFATKTFPNHFSLITGLYEESHGIIGNQMFDPVFNETFNFTTEDPKWWYNGLSVPIWVANQKEGSERRSGSVMWVSTNVPYFDQEIKYHMRFNTSVPWKERVDTAVGWLASPKDPANFVLLYIEEPDATGHLFGPESPQVEAKVMEADQLIGYLFQKLEEKQLLQKLNLIVLSDHGMAAIPKQHIIPLDKILDRGLYKTYGHSPVWQILPEPGQEEAVRKLLSDGTKVFQYTLYEKNSIPVEYHYRNNRRIMPFVIVADEGWDFVFQEQDYWRPANSTGGDHGYNNSLMSMHPVFLAHGPSFKSGFLAEPFLNLDVYPLMCHLLDLPPPKNVNGSLTGVSQLLVEKRGVYSSASSWIVARRASENRNNTGETDMDVAEKASTLVLGTHRNSGNSDMKCREFKENL